MPLAEKQGLVDEVFHSVARRYDLMNDLMSGGLHRAWKDALVTAVNPPRQLGPAASRCSIWPAAPATSPSASSRPAAPTPRVTVCDINAEMLAVGRERAAGARPGSTGSPSIEGNAEELPFAGQQLRLRHHRLRHPQRAAHRKRAGAKRTACSSMAAASSAWNSPASTCPASTGSTISIRINVIPTIGRAVTGDREAYRYLVELIRKFPKPKAFASMIEDAGFRRVTFTSMTGSVVAMHSGWKL